VILLAAVGVQTLQLAHISGQHDAGAEFTVLGICTRNKVKEQVLHFAAPRKRAHIKCSRCSWTVANVKHHPFRAATHFSVDFVRVSGMANGEKEGNKGYMSSVISKHKPVDRILRRWMSVKQQRERTDRGRSKRAA